MNITTELFTLTPDQHQAAEALARVMTERGIALTVDEAWVMANLANFVQPTIDEDPKLLGTKVVRKLASSTATAEACLATLAKHVVKQHTLAYDDVNLRALSTLQAVVAVLAVLTQDKKLKHAHG